MAATVTGPDISPNVIITDEQLLTLTADERASLVRRLTTLAAEPGAPTIVALQFPRRRWFIAGVVVACAAMSAWIFTLAQSLPARYVVGHWDAAWVGFDVMLLLSMAAVGWAAWRRVALVPFASLVTAVLLVCDAWFDVMTATGAGDTTTSALLAGCLELPLAAIMIVFAYRKYSRRR